MKKLTALVALAAFAGSAYAQLNPLPPSSALDGVTLQSIHANNVASWNSATGLGAYKFASDDNLGAPQPGTPDNALGLNWASSSAQVVAAKNAVNTQGGSIRAIFLGESAGWLNDFGYTYSGNPQGPNSYTVAENIQALPAANIFFGDSVEIEFGIGEAGTFDFWLNGVGEMGPGNPSPTSKGGVYTAFDQTNSVPYNAPGNVKWTIEPLMVSTYIEATGEYEDVATYLVGFEDWRTDKGADNDNNDLMFAVQFFRTDGSGFTPVPEPSTYGLLGAIALLGLVAFRRFKAKK